MLPKETTEAASRPEGRLAEGWNFRARLRSSQKFYQQSGDRK
jgi:hypothetical protein